MSRPSINFPPPTHLSERSCLGWSSRGAGTTPLRHLHHHSALAWARGRGGTFHEDGGDEAPWHLHTHDTMTHSNSPTLSSQQPPSLDTQSHFSITLFSAVQGLLTKFTTQVNPSPININSESLVRSSHFMSYCLPWSLKNWFWSRRCSSKEFLFDFVSWEWEEGQLDSTPIRKLGSIHLGMEWLHCWESPNRTGDDDELIETGRNGLITTIVIIPSVFATDEENSTRRNRKLFWSTSSSSSNPTTTTSQSSSLLPCLL